MGVNKKKTGMIAYYDYSLLAVLTFLVGYGLIIRYSSSAFNGISNFVSQLKFTLLGVAAMLITSKISYRSLVRRTTFFYIASLCFMCLVLTPLGIEVNGASRWINLYFFSVQPAEIVKLALILFLPVLMMRMGKQFYTFKGTFIVAATGAISVGLTFFVTDNLSTALILAGIICVLIFEKHPLGYYLALIFLAISAVAAAFLIFLAQSGTQVGGFRLTRIATWLNPEKYYSKEGFQTLNGLYAVGAGGLFGKGLGRGTQKMVIPEVHNDMVFSVICEELGLFGAFVLLILFTMLLYRLVFIARNAPDQYGSMIVTGIFAHIALQAVLNIAVVLNVIPNTGISLPFVSSGGSSMVLLFVEMGIALGVSRRIQFDDENYMLNIYDVEVSGNEV